MLAVLSTLSGTIAIKQYINNITGLVHVVIHSFCVVTDLQLQVFHCYLNFEKGTTVIRDLQSSQTFLSGGPSVPPRLTDLVKLAQECCYHSNLAVAAHGVIVLSNIAISFPEKG